MLVEAFVDFVFDLIRWLLSLIPAIEIPSFDFSAAVGVMQQFNTALPVTESLAVGAFFVSMVGALWMFQVARLIIKHVPWIGG